MKNDNELRKKGMQALVGALGTTEAMRFVAIAMREPFDYTEWRKTLFEDETLESLHEKIRDFEKRQKMKEVIS